MSYFISNKTATSRTGSIILDQGMSVAFHQQTQIEHFTKCCGFITWKEEGKISKQIN